MAAVAVGKAGATNAGYLAAQVLAVADAALAQRLSVEREERAGAVGEKNAELQRSIQDLSASGTPGAEDVGKLRRTSMPRAAQQAWGPAADPLPGGGSAVGWRRRFPLRLRCAR